MHMMGRNICAHRIELYTNEDTHQRNIEIGEDVIDLLREYFH